MAKTKSKPIDKDSLIELGFEWDHENFLVLDLKVAGIKLGFWGGVSDKMTLMQKDAKIYFGSNHPEFIDELQDLIFALSGLRVEKRD